MKVLRVKSGMQVILEVETPEPGDVLLMTAETHQGWAAGTTPVSHTETVRRPGSRRCSAGIHAYRHVELTPLPDPLHRAPAWLWVRRCTRCHLIRARTVFRIPFRIRTHAWDTSFE